MNPLTNIKNINKLNEIELSKGLVDKKSWHDLYKESAWIFIGGLPFDLTEGDVLSVFSQYGEIVNINYVRDKKTGKPKGFCFLCYANQKSTILAVDNLNGIKIVGRTIRVDHVANYKPPKDHDDDDEIIKTLKSEGCAPKPIKLESPEEKQKSVHKKEKKKHKKDKKNKKKSHSKEKCQETRMEIKEERSDAGYSKYEHAQSSIIKEHKCKKQSGDSEGSSESITYIPRQDSSKRTNFKSFRNSIHSNIRTANNDNDIHSLEHTESSSNSKKRDKEHKQKDYKRNQECESYKQDAYSKHKLKEPSSFSNPDRDNYENTNRGRHSDSSSDKEHYSKKSQSKDLMRSHKRLRHDSSFSDDSEHHHSSRPHHLRQYHNDNDSQYAKHSKKSSYSENHSRDKYKGNR